MIDFSTRCNGLEGLYAVIRKHAECLMVDFSSSVYRVSKHVIIPEQNLRHTQPTSEFSVYTIENGRRTLINYRSEVPPMRVPAHIAMKDEMPPTYEVALTMEQPAVAPPPAFSAPAVALPRRSSATI